MRGCNEEPEPGGPRPVALPSSQVVQASTKLKLSDTNTYAA